jgi:hypothetical protein
MKGEILQNALDNLSRSAGINGNLKSYNGFEGILEFVVDGRVIAFIVDVKTAIGRHQVLQLHNSKLKYKNFIVVAGYIFPKIKEELRELGISYLEANGNLFIKNKGWYFFIETNKKVQLKMGKANRAFTKTGLKVIFHLLLNRDLLNRTQREIAEECGVGLGNIPQVIEGLKETGYIIQYNRNEFTWENRKGLLDRWINAYATDLRPKLLKGKYDFKKDWQAIRLDSEKTVWGGEPAADKITNYLRPERFVIHTSEKQTDLIKNYNIIPNLNGELDVFEIFWKPQGEIAPPIIIYAELMLAGGKRNKETALKIYDEYIQPIL